MIGGDDDERLAQIHARERRVDGGRERDRLVEREVGAAGVVPVVDPAALERTYGVRMTKLAEWAGRNVRP